MATSTLGAWCLRSVVDWKLQVAVAPACAAVGRVHEHRYRAAQPLHGDSTQPVRAVAPSQLSALSRLLAMEAESCARQRTTHSALRYDV